MCWLGSKPLKFNKLCVVLSFGLIATSIWAEQPTAEQIQQFKSLSPAEQQLILDSVSTSSNNSKPAHVATLPEPDLVKERPTVEEKSTVDKLPVEADVSNPDQIKAIETNAAKAADAPEVKEKKEEKIIKQKLKQFGYELFAGSPTTFAPATDIPIPVDYIVGPGDTVIVQYYGKQNNTNELVVDRDGSLKVPGIGPVSVAGLTFAEMKRQLLDMISNQLIGVNASIGLGTLRSIRVFVLGEAYRPGSYTISALSTMTNALFVSGGVTAVGSLRKVQLKRQGKIVTELDLYDLLIKGDTSNDARLIPGDVIFVPPIGQTVGVSGEVRRPAVYELKDESSAEQILELAGGLLPTAYPQASRIERINQKGERTLIDLNLSQAAGKALQPMDGDVLQIFSVLDKMESVVMLKGHVERPGGFQWRPGIRVSDLIKSVSDLLPNPDLDYALIRRETKLTRSTEVLALNLRQALKAKGSSADLKLQPRDEILVFGLTEPRNEQVAALVTNLKQQQSFAKPAKTVGIQGNVRFPGVYPLVNGMTLKQLIKSSYDLQEATDRSYVLIKRQVGNDGRIRVLRERLDEQEGTKADFYLQPQDEVYVFDTHTERDKLVMGLVGSLQRQAHLGQAAEIVTIQGNLHFPGTYPWNAGMTLQDLIDAAYKLNKNTVLNYVALSRVLDNQGRIEFRSLDLTQADARSIALQPQDSVYFFELNENRQTALKPVIDRLKAQATKQTSSNVVQLDGLVRFPGEYPLESMMTVGRLLTAAGGFTESAYSLFGEVSRYHTDPANQSVAHQQVQLTQSGATGLSMLLQARDQLQIKQIPNWMEKETINVLGEVRFPGSYTIAKGESLAQVVSRAGGLTEFADPRAAVFTRISLQKREQEQLDKFKEQLQRDLATRSLQQSNSTSKEDAAKASQSLMMSESLLNQLESSKAVGRLVIDLPALLTQNYQGSALVLEEGDRLVIPRARQEVTTLGEVNFPTSHLYQPGFKLDDYLYGSGGLTAKADEERVYVIKANGSVLARKQGGSWFKSKKIDEVESGDTIVVPLDVETMTDWQKWTSVSQILFQLATTTAALKTVGAF